MKAAELQVESAKVQMQTNSQEAMKVLDAQVKRLTQQLEQFHEVRMARQEHIHEARMTQGDQMHETRMKVTHRYNPETKQVEAV